jgi:hypothetical protein
MYRDEVTVPRYQKFIGDVVSTCGRYVSGFACVSVRQCFADVGENRCGTGGLGDFVYSGMAWKIRRQTGKTKVTNVKGTLRVYWRGFP